MHVGQFRLYILRPTLERMNLWSIEAEQLLLGTAAQESNFQYIDQITRNGEKIGPAVGLYQMERATHDDIWKSYIDLRPKLKKTVEQFLAPFPENKWEQMQGNHYYATAMARVFYLRFRSPLPKTLPDMAGYWKGYWNTKLGKGTPDQFVANYKKYVEGK